MLNFQLKFQSKKIIIKENTFLTTNIFKQQQQLDLFTYQSQLFCNKILKGFGTNTIAVRSKLKSAEPGPSGKVI